MSSRPLDLCPSRVVGVTSAQRAAPTGGEERPRRRRPHVLLATLGPPLARPRTSGPASAQEDSFCAGAGWAEGRLEVWASRGSPPLLPFTFRALLDATGFEVNTFSVLIYY